MEISEKVAIVTGGLGGIGLLTVQYLLKNGAKYVAILDVHKSDNGIVISSLKNLEREFGKGKFIFFTCNVTDMENFTACYKEVMKQQNYVDILVNCAGILNDRKIDQTIDVNFKATVNCTMVAIDHMGKHKDGKGGIVVNISSILGLINAHNMPIYVATKHAIISFVRSMEKHNEKLGVRIVCICPKGTDTNMFSLFKLPPTAVKNYLLDFFLFEIFEEVDKIYKQKPDNVASAIIEIIRKGKPGAVWVSQNDEPPFAVKEDTDIKKLRIEI